jgi:hypothetical protein
MNRGAAQGISAQWHENSSRQGQGVEPFVESIHQLPYVGGDDTRRVASNADVEYGAVAARAPFSARPLAEIDVRRMATLRQKEPYVQVAFTEVPTHLATNSINQRTDLASHRVRLADVKTVTVPKTIVSCRHGVVALSDDMVPR